MRNLVKILALFALVLVFSALVHSVTRIKADSPPSLGQYGSINPIPPRDPLGNESPNNNITKRGYVSVPGTYDIFDYLHPTDAAPSLCNLFSDRRTPQITGLYAVGVYEGIQTGKTEPGQPHMASFKVQPGEIISTPPLPAKYGGGSIGGGYTAMVLYASNETNSITLEYTASDSTAPAGYTIHILGIVVNPDLLALYQQLNTAGRQYLPALLPGQAIGTAKGNDLWVAIRDTGSFIDPRWRNDWWVGCPQQNAPNPDLNYQPGNSSNPGYTTTPATPISTGGPKDSGLSTLPGGKYPPPVFLPLGSLEACPTEIPTNGKISNNISPLSPPSSAPGATLCNLPTIPEPAECTNPSLIKDLGNFCGGQGTPNMGWCNPEHWDVYKNAGGKFCKDDEQATKKAYGKYTNGYCINDDGGPGFWKRRAAVCGIQNDNDKYAIGRCGDYFKNSANTTSQSTGTSQTLPSCVPANNPGQQCVSECSEPLNLTESLLMFSSQGCARSGDCLIKVGIKNNPLDLPFVKQLADYFSGVLDAEHMTPAELDNMQKILRAGATDPSQNIQQVFDAAGVNRKLLPLQIQDQLKCQFIDYVKNRLQNKLNTKYTDFMIYDKKVTDIPCKLTFTGDFSTWDKYWFAVPLFQNDDSQGKIEFASPTIFSTREKGNDPKFPQTELGPVYVSIPEVNRLALSTSYLQKALVPDQSISNRSKAISTNPRANLPEYGKTLEPATLISACTTSDWSPYYNSTTPLPYEHTQNYLLDSQNNPGGETPTIVNGVSGQPLTEYSRAVACDLNSLSGAPDSQICVVDPKGQLRCFLQNQTSQTGTFAESHDQTVQVRTVFPNLFEIAEQTIQRSTGFLRIFEPNSKNSNPADTLNQGINNTPAQPATQNQFDQNYYPIPAASPIQYDISDRSITLKPPKDQTGWQLFFYRLGGLWTARNFVLQLLWPKTQ